MKGGVGKTTLTTNISIELFDRGFDVLVIDIDPQFNTTQSLFKYFKNNVADYFTLRDQKRTITTIFAQAQNRGISRRNSDENNLVYTLSDEDDGNVLDIIPGDLKLIVDVNGQAVDRINAFFNVNSLKEKYDYILIDCPPTWSQVTSVSLSLSDYYLIPTKLDDFSTIGITLLSELIGEKVNSLSHKLECLGVVYMMLTETSAQSGISNRQTVFKKDIEEFFEDTMDEEVKCKVQAFDTVIYNYEPVASQTIVYKNYTNNKGRELYARVKELTDEIIQRIDSN